MCKEGFTGRPDNKGTERDCVAQVNLQYNTVSQDDPITRGLKG